jgi:hypothetical protein
MAGCLAGQREPCDLANGIEVAGDGVEVNQSHPLWGTLVDQLWVK